VACAPAASTTDLPPGPSEPALHAKTIADVAIDLAHEDHKPARQSVYLRPMQQLLDRCAGGSVSSVADAVEIVASGITGNRLEVEAPHAAAAAVLVANSHHRTNCGRLARHILAEIASSHLRGSGNLYRGFVRFSPPLTAELVLASIKHVLLPGKLHVVYALKAFSCQQAIFMGPALGRRYGNPSLGAFVELTSGAGVGHGKYDANRVNRARISPLGRIGGQPC
jgi:hypothetical protein